MTKMILPRTAEVGNTSLLGDPSDALRDLFGQVLHSAMEAELEQRAGARRHGASQRAVRRHRRNRIGSRERAIDRWSRLRCECRDESPYGGATSTS